MGLDCSKSSDNSSVNPGSKRETNILSLMAPRGYGGFSDSDAILVESIQKDDLLVIEIAKRELKENAHVFLLNNILMSIQFFTDHKEVIKRLQHVTASPQEKEMNKTLLKDETMECTYPDAILEEVNKNIIFRTTDEYSVSQNLVSKRIYVINDLIEVVKSEEVPQYTSIDKPCYQVKIEECKRRGYLKLQQVENNAPILVQQEYDENYEPTPGPSSRSDSEYDYTSITELRTPKLIEVDGTMERRDTLPEICFTRKIIKCIPDLNSEDKDDDIRLDYLANLNEDDLLKEIIYINSNGFMKYFQSSLFPMSLGKSLGFSEDAIASAKSIPGKIFCDEVDIETNIMKLVEIIPAVSIPWPDDQTIEFICREDRPTIFDTRTGMKYRWPTNGPRGMIEEIRNMSAVLVPKGYTKKKGVNREANLEWEINFPKAERYLEARMSHAQMKCMLVLFTLYKTFIAPITGQNGLLIEHIRTHMYWECERDYRNWPEHRLGTKILMVVKNLQQKLFLGVLPDYFIKDRNLFENIPKRYLNFAQHLLLSILENPVPYFMKALKCIRYSSGKFYPSLNFEELYHGLISKNSAALVNPHLAHQTVPQLKRRLYKDQDQQMKHLKYLKKKEQILQEKIREKEQQKNREYEEHNIVHDEIDVNVQIDKQLDIWKTKSILVTFIKIFIDIAKKSTNLATSEQALFYLKQSLYLTKILEDISTSFVDELKKYRRIIALEEARIKRKTVRSLSNSEEKPPTPVRNSLSFQFTDVNQQLKNGSIRLNNLQSSYMNGLQPPPAMRNLKPATVQRSESYKQNGVPPKRKTVAFVDA